MTQIPEDLMEDWESASYEANDEIKPEPWRKAMQTIVGYIERIAALESQLAEARKPMSEQELYTLNGGNLPKSWLAVAMLFDFVLANRKVEGGATK
jgi:hypothetical protein